MEKESSKKRERCKKSTRKNIKQSILACPYCSIKGGYTIMKRWHFDNCKLKGELN